jgi:periplasmic protein TonB
MISRQVVPPNAHISATQSNEPKALRRDLLVPRNLISADARIIEEPNGSVSSVKETAAASRLMVPKLLVPPGAAIDMPAKARSEGPLAASANVFHEALLGDSFGGPRHTLGEWLISVAIHAAIVAAVLIVPLFYTQVIDLHRFEITYLAAPLVPAPPPPPPPASPVVARQAPRKALPATAKLTMPIAIPKAIPVPSNAPEAASDLVAGVTGGVAGGVPGGQIGGVLSGIVGSTGPVAPPPPPPVAEALAPSGPLHVGGEVKAPRELYKPQPKYPLLAMQARIEGDVQIDAVIDKDGNVVQVRAISGPGLLIPAALEAVKHWKYEPTYLNGVPWPLELTVHVTFTLS